MTKISWTSDQQSVLQAGDVSMTVSASAGSGKTAVLTERLYRLIESGKVDAEGLFVATFTNESANDLKQKIMIKLQDRFYETGDKKIEQQLINLENASMGTFHSYCSSLVKTNFFAAGVDASFTVMDEIESGFIKQKIIADCITSDYQKYEKLINSLGNGRNMESVAEAVITLHNFLCNQPDRDKWLKQMALAGYYGASQKIIDQHVAMIQAHFAKVFADLKTQSSAEFAKYIDSNPERLNPKYKCEATYEEFKCARTAYKKEISKYSEQFDNGDVEIAELLISFVADFDEKYSIEKQENGKLDFNDLEKYALKVLANDEIAKCEQDKFKNLFIDEYQDTNYIQEEIINKIAGKNNVFMVGDVKQSIYAFRGCEPKILADKHKRFASGNQKLEVARELNDNFRSNDQILRFVNQVFEQIMTDELADIDFKQKGKFNITKSFEKNNKMLPPVSVSIVEQNKSGAQEIAGVYSVANAPQKVQDSSAEIQAKFVAQNITRIKLDKSIYVDGQWKQVDYGDIAVLVRGKADADVLVKTFESVGIPFMVDAERNTNQIPEIAMLNNMLLSISNFYNNIALVGLMESQAFGFTKSELSDIALLSDDDIFYNKLKLSKSEKVKTFLQFLDEYNIYSGYETVYKVLTRFAVQFNLTDTSVLTFINGLNNKEYTLNVQSYVHKLICGNTDFKIETADMTEKNAVRILTIHKSKGLEFNVVYLFNASKDFTREDGILRSNVIIDKYCGVCINHLDGEQFIKQKSVARVGAEISRSRQRVAEQMRLLYVALTRAKCAVHVVASGEVPVVKSEYDILNAKSFLHFLSSQKQMFNYVSLDDVTLPKVGQMVSTAGKVNKELKQQLVDSFKYEYPYLPATKIVLKNSVSGLTKKELDAEEFKPIFLIDCDRAAERGTQFHKAMQTGNYIENENWKKSDFEICRRLVDELTKGFVTYAEQQFMMNIEQNGELILVQGVVDFLAIKENKAIIVDYKTNQRTTEQKLKTMYSEQMAYYKKAVQLARPDLEIECYIYSTELKNLLRCER